MPANEPINDVAAIGSMMTLVSEGTEGHDGTRMGVWGAAQAIAFGLGGMAGTGIVDLVRWMTESVEMAYGVVFFSQAALFLAAGWLAIRMPRVAGEGDATVMANASELLVPARQDP